MRRCIPTTRPRQAQAKLLAPLKFGLTNGCCDDSKWAACGRHIAYCRPGGGTVVGMSCTVHRVYMQTLRLCVRACIFPPDVPSHSFGPFRALRSVLSINRCFGKIGPPRQCIQCCNASNHWQRSQLEPNSACPSLSRSPTLDSDCCLPSHIANSSPLRSSALTRASGHRSLGNRGRKRAPSHDLKQMPARALQIGANLSKA